MTALLELAHAERLHRAEARWLDQCAERLRRAGLARTQHDHDPEGTSR